MHAAPGGQTGQNIDDSINDEPRLFTDSKNQDLLVDLWVKLATRYKDEPTVAAFDLLNEPLPQRTGAAPKFKAQLEPLYKRITTAIRKVDQRHMVTLEGADWANDWSVFTAKFDDNLFYQFHYYAWDQPDNLKGINPFLAYRDKLKAPVWVGETGEKNNTIYWGTTQLFESHNIGWSFWPWKKMETRNTPFSIKAPAQWDQIIAYSNGKAKPSREVATKAFNELLENIRLENCVEYPDVINAILRRVPGRIEAENYGHQGRSNSYWVKNPAQKSRHYRTSEPVPVQLVDPAEKGWSTRQAIELSADEWTAYTFDSPEARSYRCSIRVKSSQGSSLLECSLNDKSESLLVNSGDWLDLNLKSLVMNKGLNKLKLSVQSGRLLIDWIKFE